MSVSSDVEGTVELRARAFRRFIEWMPGAVLVIDDRACLTMANTQAARVFGYRWDDLAGVSVDVLLPEMGGHLATLLTAEPDGDAQAPVVLELDGRHLDGTTFPVEVSVGLIGAAGREQHILLLSAVRDVSEYRRTADEARLRMAALVDSANLGIVSTSIDGRIVSWNGGAESVLGHCEAQMLGTSLGRLLSGARGGLAVDLQSAMEGGLRLEPFDVVLLHRDGHEVHLALTPSPIIDRGRRTIGHSLVLQDISARKRAEVALEQAKEAAENTSREFEAFSYAVAHDLRAPLRAIDGFSQALLEDYPEAIDEVGQSYLAQMRTSAKYMGQLIDSLLALARLTQGDVDLQPVDLSQLARETIRRHRASDPQRRVEVDIPDGVLGRGDPTMLGLVLDNLLGNAWKYTRTRPVARIEFGCCTNGTGTTYFVKDNGIGFDMAYSDKLFGVFQRLHAMESFEGTGIGLATAKKVLQRHGGQIWAHGVVDRGASFLFTLNQANQRSGACLTCEPPEACRPPLADAPPDGVPTSPRSEE